VTDIVAPGLCPTVTSTVSTPNSFSIQLNTNTFTTTYGGNGWVQFVNQTIPGTADFLCVWKVDLDVAYATGNGNGYESVCVRSQSTKPFLGPGSAGEGGQIAEVKGFVHASAEGATLLTAWAQLPWDFPYAYAVTTTDTITGTFRGLPGDSKQYPLGLSGRWTQVTGDIYGTGCGSRAVFTGTRLFERVIASTCTSYPYCSSQVPMTQFSLPYFAAPVPDPNVTGESNNLRPTLSRFGVAGSNKRSFSCIYPEVCERWGQFHSPN
jgi:hypothetical protein